MKEDDMKSMKDELKALKIQLMDSNAALPAHSVRPHQILEIEELEDRIKELEEKINSCE